MERHEFEGNAGFSVGNAWNDDDRIRDGFEISYVSFATIAIQQMIGGMRCHEPTLPWR